MLFQKTAEERASCTRGRNQAIKKAMREEKKKEKEKEEKESRMDKLLEYRDVNYFLWHLSYDLSL